MKGFRTGIPRLGGESECVFQLLEASMHRTRRVTDGCILYILLFTKD